MQLKIVFAFQIHSLSDKYRKLKHDFNNIQEMHEELKQEHAAIKNVNEELVQEIERYAEVIDQLKSEVNDLKDSLKHRSVPKIKATISEAKKTNKKNSDDFFLSKALQTEDVCAALNSFVQSHSTLLMPNSTLSILGMEEKPVTTTLPSKVEVAITQPIVSKPSIEMPSKSGKSNWSFADTVRLLHFSNPF